VRVSVVEPPEWSSIGVLSDWTIHDPSAILKTIREAVLNLHSYQVWAVDAGAIWSFCLSSGLYSATVATLLRNANTYFCPQLDSARARRSENDADPPRQSTVRKAKGANIADLMHFGMAGFRSGDVITKRRFSVFVHACSAVPVSVLRRQLRFAALQTSLERVPRACQFACTLLLYLAVWGRACR
jgi:hypothetical protein